MLKRLGDVRNRRRSPFSVTWRPGFRAISRKAPFTPANAPSLAPSLQVSARVFERDETDGSRDRSAVPILRLRKRVLGKSWSLPNTHCSSGIARSAQRKDKAEIQVRTFAKATEIRDCELSRKLLVSHPESGGLVEQNEREPYRSIGGNDYGFASQALCANKIEPAVVVTLRERCAFCHGDQLTDVITFRMHVLPPIPPVRVLDPLLDPFLNPAADYVLSRKVECPDWKALQLYWRPEPRSRPHPPTSQVERRAPPQK
jgi:hypothetical protein